MIKAVIFDMYETLITEYRGYKYFSNMMAKDLGISPKLFGHIWHPSEKARSIGQLTFEDTIRIIMNKADCHNKAAYEKVVKTRYETKESCFSHLHHEILPLLQTLKKQDIKIGLISNCFSEEVKVIQESCLFPYFDAPILSYEVGYYKPDKEIFELCIQQLDVLPKECLYVGDGGSNELEGASSCGMNALQAVWYLKEFRTNSYRKNNFKQLEKPMDILNYV